MKPKLPHADCASCPGARCQLIPIQTSSHPRLIVVSEVPGKREVEAKKPLANHYFDSRLKRLGLDRSQCHITHAIACDVSKAEKEVYLKKAVKCCMPRLRAELAALDPDVPVAALGTFALQAVMGWSRKKVLIAQKDNPGFRGSVIGLDDPIRETNAIPRIVLPLLHPARTDQDLWGSVLDADLQRVGRLLQGTWKAPEATRTVRIVRALEDLESSLKALSPRVSFDVETDFAHPSLAKLVCFVLADQQLAVVVPWSRTQAGEGEFWGANQKQALRIVNAAIRERTIVTHNGFLFDNPIAKRHGLELPEHCEDTLIGYHTLTSHFPKALSHVVACYVDAPPWKHWDHGTDLEKLWSYCGQDGLYTALAEQQLFSQFDENDWNVYESDKRSAILAAEASKNGFLFDQERAALISAVMREREDILRAEAAELVGEPKLNLNSPKQLQAVYFGKLGARVCFRNPETGEPSLDVDALRAYAASGNPILSRMSELVLEARSVRRCRGMYVEKIPIQADGRVRPNWRSYGTETGRWACNSPNLANLVRPENDPSMKLGGIRSLYISPPGRSIVSFDVGQMEFRIAAYVSGDANMIKACSDADIHSANATMLFGKVFLEAKGDQRKTLRTLAKTSGFAVCYLAEAPTVYARLVASGVAITMQQVGAMLNALRRNFSRYYEYCDENLALTTRRGYIESPILRRKRYLTHNPDPPKAANFPIQSGAADIFNAKMWEIYQRINAEGLDALLIATVYDAGYFETHACDVKRVEGLIDEVWSKPVRLGGYDVVLPIDRHTGTRWSDL
jgi:uracil-DNA glycosylase family 4